jgi:hypothetical protein
MKSVNASKAARDFRAVQGDGATRSGTTLGSAARLPPVAAISRAEESCETSDASGSVAARRLNKPGLNDAIMREKIRSDDALRF